MDGINFDKKELTGVDIIDAIKETNEKINEEDDEDDDDTVVYIQDCILGGQIIE